MGALCGATEEKVFHSLENTGSETKTEKLLSGLVCISCRKRILNGAAAVNRGRQIVIKNSVHNHFPMGAATRVRWSTVSPRSTVVKDTSALVSDYKTLSQY